MMSFEPVPEFVKTPAPPDEEMLPRL